MIVLLILIIAFFGLLYFGFQTIQDTVKVKKYSVQYAKIEPQQFIPLSTSKLRASVSQLWKSKDSISDREKNLLDAFFKKLEKVIDAKYQDVDSQLRSDFHHFDPTHRTSQTASTYLSKEELDQVEDRFLENWINMLEKANFKPLTQKELDFSLQEDYLCTLPVEVNWNKLDEAMFTRFLNNPKMAAFKQHLPEFSNKIWIFHRGVGVDQTTDFLVLQKMDVIIVRFLNKIRNIVLSLTSVFTRRNPPANPPFEAHESLTKSAESPQVVKRITLQNSVQGVRALFQKTSLQEPTFEDLIILYRIKDQSQGRNIYVRSYKNIPMADLEIVFPETTNALRPLDIITFTITGCAGILTAIANLESDSSTLGYISLLSFLALAAKAGYDYWTLMYYYKSIVVEILFGRGLDNHSGVVVSLVSQVKGQEFKEAMLGYIFLCLDGAMTEDNLRKRVNKFFLDIQKEISNIDFEASDSVTKLVEIGLASKEGDIYNPVNIEKGLEILEREWSKLIS